MISSPADRGAGSGPLRQALRGLAPLARRWVRQQIEQHRPHGDRLGAEDRDALGPCFAAETLDALRLRRVPRLANPWFAAPLLAFGFDLDFRRAAGVTFGDTVLVTDLPRAAESWHSLLCHELIHVVQYRLLGVDGFVDAYIDGWLAAGCVYERIPLEKQAYELEARYRRGTLGPVEPEVRAAFGNLVAR